MRIQLLAALALATVIAGLPTPSAAQGRRGAPTGAEIAAKARAVRLDRALLIENEDLTSTTTSLVLIGTLADGTRIEGTDGVRVIP